MVPSAASMLSGKVDFWMDYAHMPGQGVISREGLVLDAQCASDLLLARVVDGVLVPRKIIGAREDGVAWFASGRVDALTLVRPRLRIAL
jgi:hypothetical protein